MSRKYLDDEAAISYSPEEDEYIPQKVVDIDGLMESLFIHFKEYAQNNFLCLFENLHQEDIRSILPPQEE